MKVHFLGVGSSTDEENNNTSIILTANNQNILLDCGYMTPKELWKYDPDPELLDAIWISHQHADHSFGMPAVLHRMKEGERKKPLYVLINPEVKKSLVQILDLGLPNILKTLKFEIRFIEFEQRTEFAGLNINIAPTTHNVPSYAIRISNGDKVLCYSGDGIFTDESKDLFRDCDLLVHEASEFGEESHSHTNLKQFIGLVKESKSNRSAAVHLERKVDRNKAYDYIRKSGKNTILAEKGDTIEF